MCGQIEIRPSIEKSAQDFSSDGEVMVCDWLTLVSTGVVAFIVLLNVKAKDLCYGG